MQLSRRGAGLAATLAVCATFGAGCGSKPGGGAALAPMNANDTVASVGGQSVSQAEFFTQLQNYAPNPQSPLAGQPAGRAVLQQIIGNLSLEGLAQQQSAAPTDAEVDTQYNNVKLLQDAQNIQPLEDRLRENGLTPQDVKDLQIRPQLAQVKLLTKGQPASTDAEVKAYYDANKATQFTKPDRAHVRGIALANQADAQQVYKQIQSGQKFDTFLPRSLNKQLVNGEFLQWVPLDAGKNPLLAPLIKSVSGTAAGQTTPPLSFQGAWWLIQVVEKKPKEVVSFDSVKTLIPFILTEQNAAKNPQAFAALQQQERDYQAKLATDGKITIALPGTQYTQLLSDLKNPPPAQPAIPGGASQFPPQGAPAPRR